MFTNNWATGMGANLNPQPFDDRGTRGGPGVYGNAQRSIWAYVEGDERPAVSIGVFTFNSTDGSGTTFHDVNPTVTYRPSSFLKMTGGFASARTTTSRSGSKRPTMGATSSGGCISRPSA